MTRAHDLDVGAVVRVQGLLSGAGALRGARVLSRFGEHAWGWTRQLARADPARCARLGPRRRDGAALAAWIRKVAEVRAAQPTVGAT